MTPRAWMLATVTLLVSAHFADAAGDPAEGAPLYKSNCLACHGAAGKGDGPVAAALTPPPADFASDPSKQKSEPELLAVIRKGVPNTSMPPYESALSEPQLQDVLAYVLTLRTTATSGAPAAAAVARPAAAATTPPPARVAVAGGPPQGGIPADGATTYANSCIFCHDTNTGPMLRGRQIHPAYVRYIVRNGMAAMPAFRPSEIDDASLAALADYVAKLPGVAH